MTGPAAIAPALVLLAGQANGQAPMGYMAGHGAVTNPISALGWGLLIVSIAVFVITTALLILALIRRRRVQGADETGRLPIGNSSGGLSWIYVGVGISTVVLFGCAVWTMIVLAAVAGPSSPPALTLEVRGHMWWWEVRYMSGDPAQIFTTANEIHIPVGRPVRVRLISDDVIHAFWVPALAGKMQMIPGQTNETWLQAGEPGIYRGQCTQFCGAQHAKMAFSVVAQPEAEFEAWRTAQLVAAAPPAPGPLADGEALFARRCGACHGIRGTETGGILGPDLSHLMTRGAIAADSLPNDPEHLVVWIAHPQAVKPGNQMPDIDLSDPDLHAIAVYLESLK